MILSPPTSYDVTFLASRMQRILFWLCSCIAGMGVFDDGSSQSLSHSYCEWHFNHRECSECKFCFVLASPEGESLTMHPISCYLDVADQHFLFLVSWFHSQGRRAAFGKSQPFTWRIALRMLLNDFDLQLGPFVYSSRGFGVTFTVACDYSSRGVGAKFSVACEFVRPCTDLWLW